MSSQKPPGLEHEVWVPGSQDYHGHPNYFKIYLTLLVLFVVTVLASLFDNPMLVFIIVFTISIIKGSMVLMYFMHLKWEPKLVWLLLALALMTMTFLILGLYPDIVQVERYLVPKP